MIISPSDRIAGVHTYYFARKLAQIESMNGYGNQVINLGIGSPDLLPPPGVIEALNIKSQEKKANTYQSYRGIPELRVAFSRWYRHHFKVQLDSASEILPLIGSKEGIMHISMTFLQEGDQVLVPNPGYPAYAMTARLAGAEPIYYKLSESNGWKPDLELLNREDLSKVKIMWINYPHMPTGAKADIRFFKILVAFAQKHKILLCNDNPYAFILNDKPVSLLEVEGSREVGLELNSLSKSYNMAGWRVGLIAGRSDYINAVMKFKSNMDSGMFRPIQQAAVVALTQDKSWFKSLNETYKKRRKCAWEIMDLLGCIYNPDSAGLFVWGKIPRHYENAEVFSEEILQKARVFITPGYIFGDQGEHYLRISLCSKEEVFEESKDRINMYLSDSK